MFRLPQILPLLVAVTASCYTQANLYYPLSEIPTEAGKLMTEKLLPAGNGPAFIQVNGSNANFIAAREKLKQAGHKPDDFRFISDLAFYNLQLGDTSTARTALEELYRRYPNENNILLNLALLCEKAGDYRRALSLAQKAFDLYPGANFGSGWINLRVLEFRNQQFASPAEIIKLNNTDSFSTWLNNKTASLSVQNDSLLLQLAWQLHVRAGLFPAPDAINAQLLGDFGDLVAKSNTRTIAIPYYEAAMSFDDTKKQFFGERIALMQESGHAVSSTFRWAGLIWMVPIALLLVAFIGYLINSRKNSSAPSHK